MEILQAITFYVSGVTTGYFFFMIGKCMDKYLGDKK